MVDTKACPMCAETVKSQARVCRYCGYAFGTVSASEGATHATSTEPTVALVLGVASLFWWFIAARLVALFSVWWGVGSYVIWMLLSAGMSVPAIVIGARARGSAKAAGSRSPMGSWGMALGITSLAFVTVFALLMIGFEAR